MPSWQAGSVVWLPLLAATIRAASKIICIPMSLRNCSSRMFWLGKQAVELSRQPNWDYCWVKQVWTKLDQAYEKSVRPWGSPRSSIWDLVLIIPAFLLSWPTWWLGVGWERISIRFLLSDEPQNG